MAAWKKVGYKTIAAGEVTSSTSATSTPTTAMVRFIPITAVVKVQITQILVDHAEKKTAKERHSRFK